MRLAAIAFALGTVWLNLQPALPGFALLAAAGAGAIVLLVAGGLGTFSTLVTAGTRPGVPGAVLPGMRLAGALLAGVVWAAAFAHSRLADRIDPAWEGRRVELTGVVAGLPVPLERGVRFDFDVETVRPVAPGAAPERFPSRVRLVWNTGPERDAAALPDPLRAGGRWRFEAVLKRPHGAVNAGGFDYEAHLAERGIGATGSVPAAGGTRIEPRASGAAYAIERLRESIRERFDDARAHQSLSRAHQSLSGAHLPQSGVLVALAIGEQRAIPAADWEVFVRTGTAHLMSISGLHVTMVSGLAGWLFAWLWRRSARWTPALLHALPAQKAGAAAALLAALAYCLLAGFAVPAQRTLYMVAVVALARLSDRESGASHTLALALLAVLLLDPMASVAPGFWLSFGAVAAIFLASGGAQPDPAGGWRQRLARGFSGWGRMQWAVTVALVPATLALFQQASLVSPLANAVAIPVVSWGVTPLALLAALVAALAAALPPLEGLAAPLLAVADALMAPLTAGLAALSRWEGAVWTQAVPPAWTVAAALAGAAWMLAPRGIPGRALGLVLFTPLLFHAPAPPATGELRVEMLDVGQGLAVLARTRHHALLFDAGPAWGAADSGVDAGSRIVVPALRARGVAALDAAVVSHDDSDHAGGARSVLAALPVSTVWTAIRLDGPGVAQLAAARWRAACLAGGEWNWDGVRFRFVHPDSRVLADSAVSTNDRSCVLRAETAHGAVLFVADIERRMEQTLAARDADALAARVVFMPHHGSGGASSPGFVRAVSPELALASAGYRNRFGHPRAEVVARWEQAGARVLRTDRDGAIELRFDGAGITVATWREQSRRWWRAF